MAQSYITRTLKENNLMLKYIGIRILTTKERKSLY